MTAANGPSHERSDVELRVLGAVGAGVAAFLVLAPLGLLLAYPSAIHQPATPSPTISRSAPRLQIDAVSDLAALRRSEGERLSSYGWIDKGGKALHVPIERAMSLVHQRGLSGWQRAP